MNLSKKNRQSLCGFTALVSLCILGTGFSSPIRTMEMPIGGQSSALQTVILEETPIPLAGAPVVRATTAPGTATESNSSATIDYSNAKDGYIMIKYTGGSAKVKLQITGSNNVTYTYNIAKGRGFEAFALTSGSGNYTVNVYENVSGQSYALALGKTIKATIENPLSPYLYPSQYVNYTAGSATVAQGAALAAGAADDLAVVTNVYNWVTDNISYDNDKAARILGGQISVYLPVVDDILASRKGICFDYAAVMATMLRTQNIPTRLEVGYVTGGTYHAWVSVYLKDVGWVNGIIYFDGVNWRLMDPTFGSSGKGSEQITQFINNPANYKKVYVY